MGKRAKNPVKSRLIPPEILSKYQRKLAEIEPRRASYHGREERERVGIDGESGESSREDGQRESGRSATQTSLVPNAQRTHGREGALQAGAGRRRRAVEPQEEEEGRKSKGQTIRAQQAAQEDQEALGNGRRRSSPAGAGQNHDAPGPDGQEQQQAQENAIVERSGGAASSAG